MPEPGSAKLGPTNDLAFGWAAARAPGMESRPRVHPAGALEPSAPDPRRKVLVIDDNRDQAESLGKLLSLMGHDVRLGYDGEEALRIAVEFRPDVALLDIGLPKLNGCEVARRMRSDPRVKHTLLLAQTGWGQEGDRKRTKEAGFDHHLLKPVDLAELRAILARPMPPSEERPR
jgi:CheY-like chemotaxis protein